MISIFEVGHLARVPLGTSYIAIAMHMRDLLARLPRGTEVLIDQTGVGQAVAEIFTASGIRHIGITITGGDEVNGNGVSFRVPKLYLISCVQALLDQRLLKIQRDLPEAKVLVQELKDYQVQYTALGHMTFNARSGKHDDLILALGMACWRALGGGVPHKGYLDYIEPNLGRSPSQYFVGVDLGKMNGFTAIAVVKRTPASWADVAAAEAEMARRPEPGALYEAPPEPPPAPVEEPVAMMPTFAKGGINAGIRYIPVSRG